MYAPIDKFAFMEMLFGWVCNSWQDRLARFFAWDQINKHLMPHGLVHVGNDLFARELVFWFTLEHTPLLYQNYRNDCGIVSGVCVEQCLQLYL